MSALDQLKLWKAYQKHWCEHKPSCTVYIKEDEWDEVGNWVYHNFDWMSGVAFLPHDGGTYAQMPYEDLDKYQWMAKAIASPERIDWSKLSAYEKEDHTTGMQELACAGGVCELP